MTQPEIDPTLTRLLQLKVSKYAIWKFTGTSTWNNVHAWSRGWYRPNAKHKAKLVEMLTGIEGKAGLAEAAV